MLSIDIHSIETRRHILKLNKEEVPLRSALGKDHPSTSHQQYTICKSGPLGEGHLSIQFLRTFLSRTSCILLF
jgi:hypothetical protein